jgi:hypothetical protein
MIFSEYFREQNLAFGDNRRKVEDCEIQKPEDCEIMIAVIALDRID